MKILMIILIACVLLLGIFWYPSIRRAMRLTLGERAVSGSSSAITGQSVGEWIVIIPGITGDLAQRKLLPALYTLFTNGAKFYLIGTGRRPAAIADILAKARTFIPGNAPDWEAFTQLVSYHVLDSQAKEQALAIDIAALEKQKGFTGKRLVYLATPADTFCPLTELFVSTGIIEPGREQYILYEKPFGHDEQSARELDACLKKYLPARQLYRVDHYVSHGMVHRIPDILHMPYVAQHVPADVKTITVIFHETLGVEGRGAFYDRYGALRDVIQNHVLQILAQCVVDPTSAIPASEQKAHFLSSLTVTDAQFGQYSGYRTEKDVAADSQTETYARITAESSEPQWSQVQFVLETGKALAAKRTAVIITLKDGNTITLDIAPQPGVQSTLLDFGTATHVGWPARRSKGAIATHVGWGPYENVFLDVFSGAFDSAVSSEEIFAQWHIIDAAYRLKKELHEYPRGQEGLSLRVCA